MKVLIEIDEKFYSWLKMCGLIPCISQGKVIPDNATNGEVMCILFPKATLDKVMCIDMEWWNSPYKADKGVEK